MYQAMMYMHAAQAVNKQANKDSILFIDLDIRFIEVKDIISSYKLTTSHSLNLGKLKFIQKIQMSHFLTYCFVFKFNCTMVSSKIAKK